jgi:hypothetical protein
MFIECRIREKMFDDVITEENEKYIKVKSYGCNGPRRPIGF